MVSINEKNERFFPVIQVYRGLAALMVVIHHLMNAWGYYSSVKLPFLEEMGRYGKFGVDFFFVLSGFIISYANYGKSNYSQYITKRLIRIYIPYLPIGILMYLLYVIFLPGVSNVGRDISLFRSITLFPLGNPALTVAWTLSYEMCFYLLFGLSFISKKVWHSFLFCWFVLIIFVNYVYPIDYGELILLNPYNIEFMLGYILAYLVMSRAKLIYTLILSLGGLVVFLMLDMPFHRNLLFAVCAFMLIYASVQFLSKQIRYPSIFMYIGNASYSIYLTHSLLLVSTIRWLPAYIGAFYIPVMLVICLFIGYLYYYIFEKKAMKLAIGNIFTNKKRR